MVCLSVLPSVTASYSSILLGSRRFDVPKLSQKLENLNAARTLEPLEPTWETDIEVPMDTVHTLLHSVYSGTWCNGREGGYYIR